ncbi:hypothetical protein ABZ829_35935 [Streptomyces xanthochromogenes]|uniref:hypothetical protein n=1 Tax=Streptomyces xanthochromogenes TaxID=67384 RepID=UPI00343AE7CF
MTDRGWIQLNAPQIPSRRLRAIAEDAGLEVRRTQDGSLRVCLQEGYQRTRSPLLWSERAVASSPASFAHLTELTDIPIETLAPTSDGLAKVRQQTSVSSLAAQFQLEFMFTPGEELPGAMAARSVTFMKARMCAADRG